MGIFLRGVVAAWVLGPSPAVAATLYVPSPQHPTLASAVSAATDGDSIEVDATWTPAEPTVFLDVGVTVRGAGGLASLPALVVGGGAAVILDDVSFVGLAAGPAVVVGPGAAVDLVDALFDGNALGGLIVDGASATLEGCTFRDNGDPTHWDQGVDIWVSEGVVTVGNSTFSSDATSAEEWGAVFLEGASASFVGTEFEGYRGDRGAVFHAIPGDSGGVLVLDQVTVVGAHASEEGGVAWLDHVETTVVGSVFTGLSSDGDAAGFYVSG
ncbi:MAG: hypothetical protein JRJ84_23555 [Deltaproteobacteria bacterium]|nr:hypothetical protein [Deltaproteobacteria bacterium]